MFMVNLGMEDSTLQNSVFMVDLGIGSLNLLRFGDWVPINK